MPTASQHTGGQGFLVQVEDRDDEWAERAGGIVVGVRVGGELRQNGSRQGMPWRSSG